MKILKNYEPFLFQKHSIEKLLKIIDNNNAACIFDDTGLGKTIVAVTTVINTKSKSVLVSAPVSSHLMWQDVLNGHNGTLIEGLNILLNSDAVTKREPVELCEVWIKQHKYLGYEHKF